MAYLGLKQSQQLRATGQQLGYAAQLFNYAEYQARPSPHLHLLAPLHCDNEIPRASSV